jgi:hypothetical protein
MKKVYTPDQIVKVLKEEENGRFIMDISREFVTGNKTSVSIFL